jgi:taurine dioxygenase
MTGAVIEALPGNDGFRLLAEGELKNLCREYSDLLDQGFEDGYALAYEYRENDCLFIDNLAVAHRASPEAHLPVEKQGLRIMHRSTIRGTEDLAVTIQVPC